MQERAVEEDFGPARPRIRLVDKAEEMYRQSLALYEAYLDPEHRDIAIVKANVEAAVAKRREKDVEK